MRLEYRLAWRLLVVAVTLVAWGCDVNPGGSQPDPGPPDGSAPPDGGPPDGSTPPEIVCDANEEDCVKQRIGPAGGDVVLRNADNSEFVARIPAGMLQDEQDVVIQRIPAAAWPRDTSDDPPVTDHIYRIPAAQLPPSQEITTIVRLPAGSLADQPILRRNHAASPTGIIRRQPTITRLHADGTTMVVSRSPVAGDHWVSRKVDFGEFGVRFEWPASVFRVCHSGSNPQPFKPALAEIWTSEEEAPVRVRIGMFTLEADTPSIYAGTPALQDNTEDTDVEAAFLSYLDVEGIEGSLASSSSFTGDLGLEVTLTSATPLSLDPDVDGPLFQGTAVAESTGWVVVQLLVDEAPVTYVGDVPIVIAPNLFCGPG